MELFIIRHAWAGQHGDPTWPDDSQRPLTAEGRERFARMIQRLAGRAMAPEFIVTSPMVRCAQTAEIVAQEVGGHVEVLRCDELLPGGDPKHLLAWSEKHCGRGKQIAWVGHAPDVAFLTAALIGETDGRIHFGKGSIAAIRFDDRPDLGGGELRWLATAKLLGV